MKISLKFIEKHKTDRSSTLQSLSQDKIKSTTLKSPAQDRIEITFLPFEIAPALLFTLCNLSYANVVYSPLNKSPFYSAAIA